MSFCLPGGTLQLPIVFAVILWAEPPLLDRRVSSRVPFCAEDLKARELEVLTLVVHGRSNKQIANSLGIAEKTARIHVSNILEEIGLSDRTQAAIAAIKRGRAHLE